MYVLSSFWKNFKTPSESCCRTCKRLCWDRFENPGGAILLLSRFQYTRSLRYKCTTLAPQATLTTISFFFFFYTPSEFVWMGLVIPRRYTMDPGCTMGSARTNSDKDTSTPFDCYLLLQNGSYYPTSSLTSVKTLAWRDLYQDGRQSHPRPPPCPPCLVVPIGRLLAMLPGQFVERIQSTANRDFNKCLLHPGHLPSLHWQLRTLSFFFFLLLFKINYTFDIMSSRSRRRVSEMFYKMYPQKYIAGLVSKQLIVLV